MRHGVKKNNLGRKTAHRKAMLSNMACQLITYKRITTTLAKAKALRVYVEPILTKSKSNTTHSRRIVFSLLQDKVAIQELFDNISQKVASRPGGYTRIIKLPMRAGDAADMALIELVDYNEIYTGKADAGKKKTRRGRTTSKKAETTTAVVTETPQVESTNVEENVEAISEVAPVVEETPSVEETPAVEEAPIAQVEDNTDSPASDETPKAEGEEDPKA
jgi:large subunit ribosomal protein L17